MSSTETQLTLPDKIQERAEKFLRDLFDESFINQTQEANEAWEKLVMQSDPHQSNRVEIKKLQIDVVGKVIQEAYDKDVSNAKTTAQCLRYLLVSMSIFNTLELHSENREELAKFVLDVEKSNVGDDRIEKLDELKKFMMKLDVKNIENVKRLLLSCMVVAKSCQEIEKNDLATSFIREGGILSFMRFFAGRDSGHQASIPGCCGIEVNPLFDMGESPPVLGDYHCQLKGDLHVAVLVMPGGDPIRNFLLKSQIDQVKKLEFQFNKQLLAKSRNLRLPAPSLKSAAVLAAALTAGLLIAHHASKANVPRNKAPPPQLIKASLEGRLPSTGTTDLQAMASRFPKEAANSQRFANFLAMIRALIAERYKRHGRAFSPASVPLKAI